jgi:serine protease Do
MNQEKQEPDQWMKFWRQKISLIAALLLVVVAIIVSSITAGNRMTRKYTAEIRRGGPETGANQTTDRGNALKNTHLSKTAVTGDTDIVVQIARKTGPSVVGIRTTVQTSLDQFFGEAERSGAEGSGIIISKDGYIMTNYHVVQEADPRVGAADQVMLEVFLPDKRQVEAKFIGGDPINDLAVIKINLKNLPVAKLGDSAKLQVGALAVAIGNPLGLEFAGSVTTGVVSALNRVVAVEDKTMKLIQTDAAINPGNSGGALVDATGQVVGVNTIKISVSGVEGLGFAIPINDAKPIVRQLIKYGYVKGRPMLGVSGREISKEVAQYYHLPVGILIARVAPDGGAAKAGIQKKDILVSLAGKRVATLQDLNTVKKCYKAGDTVKATVVRGKKTINLKLTFTEER